MRAVALTILILLLSGCDKKKPAPRTVPAPPDKIIRAIELRAVAALTPDTATHLGADGQGVLYWSQETDEGNDVVFSMGNDGVPYASTLSASAICRAMGEKDGTGNIQSLVVTRTNDCLAYFVGGRGRKTLACWVRWNPYNGRITVLADQDYLGSAAKMGDSIELARGKVLLTDEHAWLLLRHTDRAALFRMDLMQAVREEASPSVLVQVQTPEGTPIDLTNANYDLHDGSGYRLLMTDLVNARICRVNADGSSEIAGNLAGLPRVLSEPATDGDRIVLFAHNGEPLQPEKLDHFHDAPIPPVYPSMVIFDATAIRGIGPEAMRSSAPVAIDLLRITVLKKHPTELSWLAYDAPSGRLLQVRPLR